MNNFEEGNTLGPQLGIKPSKKFASGTVQENGTGKLEIVDRYLENNIVMLKYKWLTGLLKGQIETNKEQNINASIWKFKKVRGLTGDSQKNDQDDNALIIVEVIEKLDSFFDNFDKLEEKLHSIQQQINEKFDKLEEHVHSIQQQFKGKNDTINRLLDLTKANQEQIQTLVRNYDLANKLIDKI